LVEEVYSMEAAQIAQSAADVLMPALPYLMIGGKEAAENAEKQISIDSWARAKRLWGIIGSKLDASAKEKVKNCQKDSNRIIVKTLLEDEIRKLLIADDKLKEETVAILLCDSKQQILVKKKSKIKNVKQIVQNYNESGKIRQGIIAEDKSLVENIEQRFDDHKWNSIRTSQKINSKESHIEGVNQETNIYIDQVSRKPFMAPRLPEHYVPRSEISAELKERLKILGENESGILVVSAIHGLGGIGKTILAIALTHDKEIIDRFPDGMLWVTLGQEPDILSLLNSWVNALGDYEFRPTTIKAASMHLGMLLYDKRCLLIIDDAWSHEDVTPFSIGGPKCQVLITTRDSLIAKAANAALYELDVMNPDQALKLLRNRLRRDIKESERIDALRLAVTVDYLPLALELAAIQVKDGISWGELIADLQAEIARLETLTIPGAEEIIDDVEKKRLSLKASFRLSLKKLSADRLYKFAWIGVLPEDTNITPEMAAVLWQISSKDARDMLLYFKDKALLILNKLSEYGDQAYRIHDLLHDLARSLLTSPIDREPDIKSLGLDLEEANSSFLKRYLRKTNKNQWYTLPDDGYIHNHLIWHMQKAGWNKEIHALLCEETSDKKNSWYLVREKMGQSTGFLEDVSRAWRLAESDSSREFEEKGKAENIGIEVRYALITASINSLSANIPLELLISLVKNDIWTPIQGLAYARQMPKLEQHCDALRFLVPLLPKEMRDEVLDEYIEIVRKIKDDNIYASKLGIIAYELAEPQRGNILNESLDITRRIQNEKELINTLTSICFELKEPLRDDVFKNLIESIANIRDEAIRADLLMKAAANLSESKKEQMKTMALAATNAIQFDKFKILTLEKLFHQKLDSEKSQNAKPQHLIPEIYGYQHNRALMKIRNIKQLPKTERIESVESALDEIKDIQDRIYRASILIDISKALCDEYKEYAELAIELALEDLKQVKDEQRRAEVLIELASIMPKEMSIDFLELVKKVNNSHCRGRILMSISPSLTKPLLKNALDIALEIKDDKDRAEFILKSAKILQNKSILVEILRNLKEIKNELIKKEIFYSILNKSSPDMLIEICNANIDFDEDGLEIIKDLISRGKDTLKEEDIIQSISGIKRPWNKVKLQIYASEYLSSTEQKKMLDEALEASAKIRGIYKRISILSDLQTKLDDARIERSLRETLGDVRNIPNDIRKLNILAKVSPMLEEPLLNEALSIIDTIEDRYDEERKVDIKSLKSNVRYKINTRL
jgi:hypothetical protein